jgi:Spy/CpxP family protein refolding chaperone
MMLIPLVETVVTQSHEGEEEGEMGGHRMIAELNLSDEQIAKLKTERLSTQKQMIRDMAEMKTLHLDLAEATAEDKPDMAKIEKLIKQISAQQEQLLLNRTKSFLFLRSLLTSEQKRKMDAMHMQKGMMGGRHGREGHGGK